MDSIRRFWVSLLFYEGVFIFRKDTGKLVFQRNMLQAYAVSMCSE